MPKFRYEALAPNGEIVRGTIAAASAAEVAHRFDALKLVPIKAIVQEGGKPRARFNIHFGQGSRPEDVTIFTHDLALLLKAGARLDDALDLLSGAVNMGRLRSVVADLRAAVVSGESLAEALARHPALFPPLYVALVRVAESSGTLDRLLEVIASERARAEALRRKVADALRYPAFVLLASGCVLVFFLTFVMPQFGGVLRDFGGRLDGMAMTFLALSEFMNAHKDAIGLAAIALLLGGFLLSRDPRVRAGVASRVAALPGLRSVMEFYRTALFCRNLGVLLNAGVALTLALRILADLMSRLGGPGVWTPIVEQVRHGGKLSDALAQRAALPAMAVRMLRLGEETGQLPVLAARVADVYEAKLQRSIDQAVAMVGPLAIIAISVVVGGLIVSVMTSLLSVTQMVG